jgi:hypothetical protein
VTRFTQWTAGAALQRFVGTYERARPLRLPSRLSQPEMIRALLAETGGITHRIMQCLNSAAIVAIHEGIERITPDLLKVERAEPGRILAARRLLTDGSTRRENSACKKGASPSAIEARA